MAAFRWGFLTLAFAFALVLVFANASESLAEVYRWKDSNGKVHFSDQPISTDPQVVQEVAVPAPNLAEPFKPRPKTPTIDTAEASEGDQDLDQLNPSGAAGVSPKPRSNRGVAADRKESCQEKVAAYRASKACFESCSRPLRGGTVNTAGCEQCRDQPMPQCWSRN